eukprot:5657394-Pyramimonas_sp.AAC.1
MQHILLQAHADKAAIEEANRRLADSEAEKRAMARRVEQEKAAIAEDAQKRILRRGRERGQAASRARGGRKAKDSGIGRAADLIAATTGRERARSISNHS